MLQVVNEPTVNEPTVNEPTVQTSAPSHTYDRVIRPPRRIWDIVYVNSITAYNDMLEIMHTHYNVWKDINSDEGVLKTTQCNRILNTLTALLTPRCTTGTYTVFGKLPIHDLYNKSNIGKVIGQDGYFTKLTTHNTGIDFIWFDDLKNEFLFWGRYKRNVAKAIDLINWRVCKYSCFASTDKHVNLVKVISVANNTNDAVDANNDTINPVWSASEKSDIPEEVQDNEPLKLNEVPITSDLSSMMDGGVINETDTNMLGGIITKIIEMIGGGDTTTFS